MGFSYPYQREKWTLFSVRVIPIPETRGALSKEEGLRGIK